MISRLRITKKNFSLLLITMALSITYISSESISEIDNENYRMLQLPSSRNDTCSNIVATKPSDCFAGSVNSDKCCNLKVMNRNICKTFDEKSEVKKSLDALGGLDKMNVYLTTSLLGSAEVQCSDQSPISEDLKTLAGNCGSLNPATIDGCSALSNKNVQCCFSAMIAKNLGNLNVNACAGIIAPMKMASFSMSLDGEYSALFCSVNSEEKTIMDSCGSTIPEKDTDCTKLSKGDILCKFLTYEKAGARVKACMGVKGNIEMMKEIGIEPRLRTISFDQAPTSASNGLRRINVNSIIIYFILVVLSFLF